MEGRYLEDGNLIGRLGAVLFLAAAGVLLARVCATGGKLCPLGGDCSYSLPEAPKK